MKVKSLRTFVAITLVILTLGVGSYVLGWSNLLTVRSIKITGAPTQGAEIAITRSLNLVVGEKLARVDPRSLATRLAANSWIQSSQVSRNWLNGRVEIFISPRVPIALYTEPGRSEVALDASGKTFISPVLLPTGLPKVSATSITNGLVAIKVFAELPTDFRSGIARLSASRETNLLIYGNFQGRGLRIIWGDARNTALKVKVINTLLEQPENKGIRVIDVTAPYAPIVK